MKLSNNFSFEELTDSTRYPELVPANRKEAKLYITNLENLAKHILQPLRDGLTEYCINHINSNTGSKELMNYYNNIDNKTKLFNNGFSITVTSGFRGPSLNKKVGGKPNGAHPEGCAADIQTILSVDEVFKYIMDNKTIFNGWLDKCIIEKIGGKLWIHIAVAKSIETARCAFYTTTDGKTYNKVA